jgi:GDP-L-fucose synthase
MKILLTGASGMVGTNLRECCPPQHCIKTTTGDLRKIDNVVSNIPQDCDLIIHAAGKVGGILANQQDPYGYLLDNAMMGMNIVAAAKARGVPRVLNLGSSCMYPKDLELLTEDLLMTGRLEESNEGYALAKILVQRLCHYSGLAYKTIIPCNLFGKWDKFDSRAHLIPAIIAKMVGEPATVEIWGDGQSRREFLYAGDFARMVWKCVDMFDSLPSVMNIGVGEDHTVPEYYEMVREALGLSCSFTFDLSKPAGMRRKLLDVSKSANLGIAPSVSIKQGIAETIQWYKEHKCTL